MAVMQPLAAAGLANLRARGLSAVARLPM